MKIKEKVLKELGCNEGEEEKAIDLTLAEVGKVIKKLTNEDNISDSIDPDRDNFFLVENYLDSEELKKKLGIEQNKKGWGRSY